MIEIINNNRAALTAAQAGNWSLCASTLASDMIDVIDDTGWKLGDISDRWGDEAANIVYGTVDAIAPSYPLAKAALTALLSDDGLRLHTPERQAMIDQWAAIGYNGTPWSDELRDGIKALGVQRMSKWKQSTGTDPTAESVQAVYEAAQVNVYDKRSLLLSVNRRSDGKTSISARLHHLGTTVGGDVSTGQVDTLNVADTTQPQNNSRDQEFVDAIVVAIEAYIAGGE